MASSQPRFIRGLTAGADLSSDASLYKAVKLTASNSVVAAGAGEKAIGFLHNKPTSGQIAEVAGYGGESHAKAGASIAITDLLKVDANGALVPASAGDVVVAIPLETASSGDIFTVFPVLFDAADVSFASEAEVLAGTEAAKAVSPAQLKPKEAIIIDVSRAEDDTLATGDGQAVIRMPYKFKLSEVRASVAVAPVGSTLNVDIRDSGTTIFSTGLTIDAGEKTSTTAATAAVISDDTLADDAEINIDIDQVGSSTAGSGLKIYLIGNRID